MIKPSGFWGLHESEAGQMGRIPHLESSCNRKCQQQRKDLKQISKNIYMNFKRHKHKSEHFHQHY